MSGFRFRSPRYGGDDREGVLRSMIDHKFGRSGLKGRSLDPWSARKLDWAEAGRCSQYCMARGNDDMLMPQSARGEWK